MVIGKIVLYNLEALILNGFGNEVNMIEVSGFHFNAKETAVYAFGITLFIMNTGNVTAAIGNDAGNFF